MARHRIASRSLRRCLTYSAYGAALVADELLPAADPARLARSASLAWIAAMDDSPHRRPGFPFRVFQIARRRRDAPGCLLACCRVCAGRMAPTWRVRRSIALGLAARLGTRVVLGRRPSVLVAGGSTVAEYHPMAAMVHSPLPVLCHLTL